MQHWIPLASIESFLRTSPDKRISADGGYYAAQKALLAHPAVLLERTIIVVYMQQITACYLLYFLQNRCQCTCTCRRLFSDGSLFGQLEPDFFLAVFMTVKMRFFIFKSFFTLTC